MGSMSSTRDNLLRCVPSHACMRSVLRPHAICSAAWQPSSDLDMAGICSSAWQPEITSPGVSLLMLACDQSCCSAAWQPSSELDMDAGHGGDGAMRQMSGGSERCMGISVFCVCIMGLCCVFFPCPYPCVCLISSCVLAVVQCHSSA